MAEVSIHVEERTKGGILPDLPPFPARLSEHAAVDKNSLTLFVTKEKRSDSLILTWLAQVNEILGPQKRFYVQILQIDEIAQLRSRGTRSNGQVEQKNDDTRIMQAALNLIRRGAEIGASDIHLLMRGTHAEAQVRVKGGLLVLERMAHDDGEALSRATFQGIATVKDSSYNPLEFQNAQISGEEMSRIGLTSVRLVRGPAFPIDDGGGFVVMRLQYMEGGHGRKDRTPLQRPRKPQGDLNLKRMGYTDWQVDQLKYLARCPNGIILFTGPTGSGKTTGLNEMMKHIARERPDSRLVTIEDPVEYPMPWAVQLVVTNASDAASTAQAFTERLRAALRMDPDIILMGEIRDADSAIVAIDAALTGHQVWGTLHVTDPFKTIGRLELMDNVRLARGVVCDPTTLRGIVAQRLVPMLCPHCAVPLEGHEADLPKTMLEALATYGRPDDPDRLSRVKLRGEGCDECSGDAISGRTAVAEVVVTDARLMKDFIEHGVETARRNHRLRPDTDNSMVANTMPLVLEGKVDPRDVEKNIDIIVPKGEEG